MWCLSCFKPSTSEDPYEAEINLAVAVSQHDADNQEAKQLASAIQESCRLHQLQEKEEKRRTRELEKDEQIALSLQYEESDNKSALDEQPAKIAVESPKDKGKTIQFEEQTNKEEELALTLQESLNMVEPPPPPTEERKSITRRAALDVEEQLAKERLKEKEKGKGKVIEDEQFALIVQESLNMVEPPPRLEENSSISSRVPMYEDEQRIIWESLKGKDQITQSEDEVEDVGKLVEVNPRPRSMCGGCYCEIEQGRSVDVLGVLWHPECLICGACHNPIAIPEIANHVSNSRGKFHKNCYRRYCYVCQEKVMIRMVSQHPFWKESYCPSHESDGTHKCCSCERLEPRGTNFVKLDDGRWLCLECMDSAVMDSHEAVPLHIEIREFFEGLNMKIEREFSFLLVETQALNKAEKQEKIDNQHGVVTRGICLSEEQFVTSVSKGPKMGPNKQLIGMATESQRVASEYEVTAILILYGLPRLLTGYILAHEMMHAYLRLNGYKNLNNVTEEGICQVLGHMWLESQTYAPAASSSSSRTPREAKAGKKGEWSEFEKKLVEFCKYQIETDESAVYGDGFRKVNRMVTNSNLRDTLKVILRGRG